MSDNQTNGGDQDLRELAPDQYPTTLRISEFLKNGVSLMGRFGSWMILPLIIITCFDIIVRKVRWSWEDGTVFSLQMEIVERIHPLFRSTLLQELEWHFHTALFALVLGYGYISNSHVRVDLVRERLKFDTKAYLEFVGLSVFMIPFTAILIYFAVIYAFDSFSMNEISASTVGLSHRWIIKVVLVVGLLGAFMAGWSVWFQVYTTIFGDKKARFPLMTIEWPEEEGSKIEGKERLDLGSAVDELERRAKKSGHMKPASQGSGD